MCIYTAIFAYALISHWIDMTDVIAVCYCWLFYESKWTLYDLLLLLYVLMYCLMEFCNGLCALPKCGEMAQKMYIIIIIIIIKEQTPGIKENG